MITITSSIGTLVDQHFGLLMWTSFVHFLLIILMNGVSCFWLFGLLRRLSAPIYAVFNLIKPARIISCRFTPRA